MVLKIGKGSSRASIRKALKAGGALTISYKDILEPEDIRVALAGIQDAGTPEEALPLLAWLASHPSTPKDVLTTLSSSRNPEILVSLAMNRNIPKAVERSLRRHRDPELRERVAEALAKRRP